MSKTSYNIKTKNHTIENKTDNDWEKIGTTYCLGCKDYNDNFRLQEIKMTNKVLREKSNCVFINLVNQDS